MVKRRVFFGWWAVASLCITVQGGCDGSKNRHSDSEPETHTDATDPDKAETPAAIVARLSVDDKLNLMSGPGYTFESADGNTTVRANTPLNYLAGSPYAAGFINGVENTAAGIDLPSAVLCDGPAGLRLKPDRVDDGELLYATAFPVGTLLASSWDIDLVQQVGEAVGKEADAYGVDFWLAPGMNIQRNPLCGRNFEYYSEDPLLSGLIGAAVVQGAQAQGVGATIKHFAANNAESNRFFVDNHVTPRALREIYLRGFQWAVELAQPRAIMTAYNKVNGTFAGQRPDLLTSVAREEWGFEGLIMSDWWGGDDPIAMVNAGTDLIQPGGANPIQGGEPVLSVLQQAYEAGDLTAQEIDRAALHILQQSLQGPSMRNGPPSNDIALEKHAELCRTAAAESMVLLKNDDHALPIAQNSNVATFGINFVNTFKGGGGSGDVYVAHVTTLLEGFAERFSLDEGLRELYLTHFEENRVEHVNFEGVVTGVSCTEAPLSDAQIAEAAANNAYAVVGLGRVATEGEDRTVTEGDYLLSADEQSLLERVSTSFHEAGKPVVVVLNVAGVVDTSWADLVDAVLLAYLPGQEAGSAVADVVCGAVNPSGKLAQTFPLHYEDVPSATSFPGIDENGDGAVEVTHYNEGIYVGYRYYNTFDKDVAYPFGHGLSYSTFTYGQPELTNEIAAGSPPSGQVTIRTTVTNAGELAGKEVVQVYIQAPEGRLAKPAVELKAFAKTSLLQPGATAPLTLTIPAQRLASFDAAADAWIIERGDYHVYVSPSSNLADIAPIQFTVPETLKVRDTTPGALALPKGVAAETILTVGAAE